MSQTANRVYRSAKVYSVALDGTEIHAQALAIKDGKFVYVGDEAGVEAWIGDSTETIDCNGKSVIPGLGDAHQHNAQAAMKLGTYSFSHIVPNPMTDTPESVQEADGSPSGYISEPAVFRPIIDRIPNYEFSAKEHRDCQKKAFELFNKDGYTLLCDCQQAESAYEVLSEMAKNGEFTARVSGVHNDPSKSLIDNGVMCAYGSDFPVNPAYGLAGIQVAMTRKNVKIDPDYELYKDVPAAMPEECVSLKEALQAHTIHVAYQAHLEDVTGSIEVGKSAELAVLDNDIETTPVEEIQDIKVLETVFMGKTVFKSL